MFLHYEIRVRGIYGRKRTAKFTTVKLAEVPEAVPMTVEQLLPLMREAVAKLKIKSGKVEIAVYPVEVDGPIKIVCLSNLTTAPLYVETFHGIEPRTARPSSDGPAMGGPHAKAVQDAVE
jgi:hypothetical protein